jgi:uncharacterized protein (TIGR02246 family)
MHPESRVALACLFLVVSLPARGAAQAGGPRAVVDGFIRAWNAHDMKAFGELFAEDADFVNVGGKWWKGRARIQAHHEQSHATRFKNTMLVETNTTVRMVRPDVAVLVFEWELSGEVDPDGKPAITRHGIMQIVAVQQGGVWSIVSAQNTNAMPPV